MSRPQRLIGLATFWLAACSSDTTNAPREPLPPLTDQRWYVQVAEGQPLPALIAHRLVDGSLEQVFLDSAIVEFTADGTWTRRFWMQRFFASELMGAEVSQVAGTWTATPDAYDLVVSPGGRRFALREAPREHAVLQLPGLGAHDVIVATIGSIAPAKGPFGSWRLTAVREQPLPSAIYVFDNYLEQGVLKSIHLVADSARIVLHPNGRYTHRIHFTEWEGAPGGPPATIRYVWQASDFGSFTRRGALLDLASGWLNGMRLAGEFAESGPLRMQHGISHGDEWVAWRYVRE